MKKAPDQAAIESPDKVYPTKIKAWLHRLLCALGVIGGGLWPTP